MTELTKRDINRGYQRAYRKFPLTICERCGATEGLQHHHKDRNPLNNERENVVVLCRRCHDEEHGEERSERMRGLFLGNQFARGEKNGNSKLTADQVESIRSRWMAGEKQIDLARCYRVSPSQICLIVNGDRWAYEPKKQGSGR